MNLIASEARYYAQNPDVRVFADEMKAFMDEMAMTRLRTTEEACWRLMRRFLGPGCPKAADDVMTVLNLRGIEVVQIVLPTGAAAVFILRQGERVLDQESALEW
jgi:hypothetical protein